MNDAPLLFPDPAELESRLLSQIAIAAEQIPNGAPEKAVLAVIKQQRPFGRDRAISIERISQLLHINIDARTIRGCVKYLLEEHGIPIGSCRVPGRNGYFLCVTDQDAEEASSHLKSEILSLYRRLKVISPKSSFVRHLQGQMELLEKEIESCPKA